MPIFLKAISANRPIASSLFLPSRLWMAGTSLFALSFAAVSIATPGAAWAASGGQGILGASGAGGAGGVDGDAASAEGKLRPTGSVNIGGGGGATNLTNGRGGAGGGQGGTAVTPGAPGGTGTDGDDTGLSLVDRSYAGSNGNDGPGSGAGVGSGGGGGGGVGVRTTLDLIVTENGAVVGGNGGSAATSSGGGGGGVGIFTSANVTIDTRGRVTGGAGGGLKGASSQAGGGGAAAAIIVTGGGTVSNSGTLTGGMGGDTVGNAATGAGGGGGEGVLLTNGGVVINRTGATITGGDGGMNGLRLSIRGIDASVGGAGIRGAGVTVVNAGTITGGMDGDISTAAATTRADAITFTGGVNSLEIWSTSVITGNVQAFSAADSFILGGDSSGTFDVTLIDAGAQYRGFGNLEKTGTSMWTLIGNNTTFAGLTTVKDGALSVKGILGGTVDVLGGRLQGTGTVGSTANFLGGIIAPGNSIGTLTVAGNYTSNGGSLEVEAELGTDSSPTDLLHITGDSLLGTGATQVRVLNVGGTGAETTGDGIRIVQVDGASAADAFVLAGPAIGGAYRYNLFQNDLTALQNDGDWYLRSAGLAPTLPIYENYPQVLLGMIALPTLEQRVGERRPATDDAGMDAEADRQAAVWTRIETAHSHVEARASIGDTIYDSNTALVQIGVDGQLSESTAGMLVGGLTAQFSHASADIFSSLGDGSNTTNSYGIGATLTWYGENGFYVDGQAQIATLRSDLNVAGVGKVGDGIHGSGYALSLEAGRKIALGNEWSLTPQAQLAYASVDFDAFTDPFGAEVALRKGDSLKGRLGMSVNYDADATGIHVYSIANLTYEFLDGTSVAISGIDASFAPQRFGGELGVGGTYKWADGKYALNGEALASTSFAGSYGLNGTVGLTVGF